MGILLILPFKISRRNMHLTFLPCQNVQNTYYRLSFSRSYIRESFSLWLDQAINKQIKEKMHTVLHDKASQFISGHEKRLKLAILLTFTLKSLDC